MRIIAGELRHRKLLGPPGDQTSRPITDRVKESLFARLTSMGLMEGGTVLDVFAGTGSLGLEALSRGVEHCTFVEKDYTIRGLLRQNLENLGVLERATLLAVDATKPGWVQQLGRLQHAPFSVVFCDPPYRLTDHSEGLERILGLVASLAAVTEPGGVLVLRTDSRVKPGAAQGWTGPVSYRYGSMATHFYQRA